jgi:hypothetical protein
LKGGKVGFGLSGELGVLMASSSEGGLTLCYAEAPCFVDVSVSQIQSTARHPSFSQAVDGGALPTRVQLRWTEPHCAKRRRGGLIFARVSVSQEVASWQEGAFGEFVRESNRRLNQVFRLADLRFPHSELVGMRTMELCQ